MGCDILDLVIGYGKKGVSMDNIEEKRAHGFSLIKKGVEKSAQHDFEELVKEEPDNWVNLFGLCLSKNNFANPAELNRAITKAPEEYKSKLQEIRKAKEELDNLYVVDEVTEAAAVAVARSKNILAIRWTIVVILLGLFSLALAFILLVQIFQGSLSIFTIISFVVCIIGFIKAITSVRAARAEHKLALNERLEYLDYLNKKENLETKLREKAINLVSEIM